MMPAPSAAQFKIPPALYPIRILQDKFDGEYSGGRWIAYVDDRKSRDDDVWNGSQAGFDRGWTTGDTDEVATRRFWTEEVAGKWWIAVGDTPNDAVTALLAKALGERP
jgi:hypothetical protein